MIWTKSQRDNQYGVEKWGLSFLERLVIVGSLVSRPVGLQPRLSRISVPISQIGFQFSHINTGWFKFCYHLLLEGNVTQVKPSRMSCSFYHRGFVCWPIVLHPCFSCISVPISQIRFQFGHVNTGWFKSGHHLLLEGNVGPVETGMSGSDKKLIAVTRWRNICRMSYSGKEGQCAEYCKGTIIDFRCFRYARLLLWCAGMLSTHAPTQCNVYLTFCNIKIFISLLCFTIWQL